MYSVPLMVSLPHMLGPRYQSASTNFGCDSRRENFALTIKETCCKASTRLLWSVIHLNIVVNLLILHPISSRSRTPTQELLFTRSQCLRVGSACKWCTE